MAFHMTGTDNLRNGSPANIVAISTGRGIPEEFHWIPLEWVDAGKAPVDMYVAIRRLTILY